MDNVSEVTKLGETIFTLKNECERIQALLKEPQEKLEEAKAKMLAFLEQSDLENVAIKGFGKIGTVTKMSVKVPSGEMRDLFFESLSREDYLALRTVNSNSLNSWYNEKLERAAETGAIDFVVAGIEEPKAYKHLSIRKG